MTSEEAIKASLVEAHELIRGLTEMVADLGILVAPLVRAFEPPQDNLTLRQAYLKFQEKLMDEGIRTKHESLDVCDQAIRRAKES
jgi:hypothetical protein